MKFTDKAWDVSRIRNASISRSKLLNAIPKAIAEYIRKKFKQEKPDGKFPDDVPLDWFALPYKEPDGTININAVRNALARISQVKGIPQDVLADARKELEEVLSKYKKEEMGELVRLPIARAGHDMFSKKRLSIQDIDSMIANFGKYIQRVPVKLEHVDIGPQLGEVKKLEKQGDVLYAYVEPVEKTKLPSGYPSLHEALSGSYPDRSIEFYRAGNDVILRAVALLGAAQPALKNIPREYQLIAASERETFTQSFSTQTQDKEGSMSDKKDKKDDQVITPEKLAELEQKLNEQVAEKEKLAEQVKKYQELIEEQTQKIAALQNDIQLQVMKEFVNQRELHKRCPDKDIREHLPEILAQTKGYVVKLGEQEMSVFDILVKLISSMPSPFEGVEPVKFDEGDDPAQKFADIGNKYFVYETSLMHGGKS